MYARVCAYVSANEGMTSDGYRLIAFFGRGFSSIRGRADGTSTRERESERERREKRGDDRGRKIEQETEEREKKLQLVAERF